MATKQSKRIGLADALRKAVKASGLSVYMVAKRAALPVSGVQRFISLRGAQLNTDTAERMAAAIDLRIELLPAKGAKGGA